jgi:hypothetical protein
VTTSFASILEEAIRFEADAFDSDQDISGADLVQWFADWRLRARALAPSTLAASSRASTAQEFLSQLAIALELLFALEQHADADPLVHALDHGGIQITAGSFRVTVFKHRAKEDSCNRR